MLASGFTIAAQAATGIAAAAVGNNAGSALLISSVVLTSLSGLAGNSLVTDLHDQLPRPAPDPDARRWNNDILRASALAIGDILRKCATEKNETTSASIITLANAVTTIYDELDDHEPMAVVTEEEVRQGMERGDAFRQEPCGSATVWTAFLHYVVQTNSKVPAIAQAVLDDLGEAIVRGFNNQLFQVLKFDFDSERSPIRGHAYAAITLKLLMQSAATQREALQQISEMRQEQREQSAAILAALSAGLASGLSQTASAGARGGAVSNTERKKLRRLAKILEGSAKELRTCRESLRSLHSLPDRIAALIDASVDQVQARLCDIQQEQMDVKHEVRSSHNRVLVALCVIIIFVASVGYGVWRVKRNTDTAKRHGQQIIAGQTHVKTQVTHLDQKVGTQGQQIVAAQEQTAMQVTDLAAKLSEVQRGLSELRQQQDSTADPISKWPQARLESALANHLNLNVDHLRAILTAGSASLDALVAGQALLALGKQGEADKKFDVVIENESPSVQRLWRAYLGKAHIASDTSRFEEALTFYRKTSSLIDKDAEPPIWASVKMAEVCTLYELNREDEIMPALADVVIFALGNKLTIDDSPRGNEILKVFEPTLRIAIRTLLKMRVSPLFNMGDIRDSSGFIASLASGSEPVSRFVWDQFSHAEKQTLTSPLLTSHKAQAELALILNRVVNSKAIFSDELMGGLQLRDTTRLLAAREFPSFDEKRLNRQVLEDAYPQYLIRKDFSEAGPLSPDYVNIFGAYIFVCRRLQIPEDDAYRRLRMEQERSNLSMALFEPTWQEALKRFPKGPFSVTVMEVIPGGQGPGLGIRVGDILKRYNGEEITKVIQVVQLTGESRDDGVGISLEIQRGTETLKLTAKPGRLGLLLENKPRE